MKIFIFMAFFSVACETVTVSQKFLNEWNTFKITYRLNYPSEDEESRKMKNFINNKHLIAKHNLKFQRGEVDYELGINELTHWSSEEVNHILNGFNKANRLRARKEEIPRLPRRKGEKFVPPHLLRVPNYVNWTENGAVNPVEHQGPCGSCYAFTSLGALEGQIFLKNKTLPMLSVQNIIDCSEKFGNDGCSGGLFTNTYNYIKNSKGVNFKSEYPYEAMDDTCRFDPLTATAKIKYYSYIEKKNEEHLKLAVASVGPIAVAIDSRSSLFHHYKRGIFHNPNCSSSILVHAVLLVGYGTDPDTNKDYWLIKNSWGKHWGENGYMRIARNKKNHCGIATLAYFPLL